jgi:predicted CXXCH cytochrome family protein
MDESRQTQKEVGRKYRDNLGYFKRAPFLAREKWWLCVLAVLLGIYGIVLLEKTHRDNVYNPAPLSISHAPLEGDCAACHTSAIRANFQEGTAVHAWKPVVFGGSASINHACESCHQGMELHQPTAETLALSKFHSTLHLVAGTDCFECHQEHLGRIALRLPGDSACAACHNDAAKMADFNVLPLTGTASRVAMHGITQDGVVHFIPPERHGPMPLFASFERGHPPFEYEAAGLKDPDPLKFSHHQHLHLSGEGMKLGCADCHKAGADGVYYGQVTYAEACQRCHMLQLDPAHPDLVLPHGDVAGLRTFLHSLVYQYERLDAQAGTVEGRPVQIEQERPLALQQAGALLARAKVTDAEGLEHEILFTADPYKDHPITGQRPFFPGCAYCHDVTGSGAGEQPVIPPPQMAERWLAHGAFTHAPHVGLAALKDCTYCHRADASNSATDIMMPSQASCIMCHSSQGTAPSNCLACHSFHSPQTVVDIVKPMLQKAGAPPLADCPAVGGGLSRFLVSDAHARD